MYMKRFLCPNHKQIDALSLSDVKEAITEQLNPINLEVSLAGDLSIENFEQLVLKYMGTVPPHPIQKLRAPLKERESIAVRTLGRTQQIGVYLPDSDERAMGYLSGPAPNKWGYYSDGETVSSLLQKKSKNKDSKRDHRLFGYVALAIIQEVANRRLFSVVREERQLTYDASFRFQNFDSILGGWYIVSVTSSPR